MQWPKEKRIKEQTMILQNTTRKPTFEYHESINKQAMSPGAPEA
jgi:hypothetical protein